MISNSAENFHHLYALLSQLKIPALDGHRKGAKQKYNEALNVYVTRHFGRPLEKLNVRMYFQMTNEVTVLGLSNSKSVFFFLVIFRRCSR